MIGLGKTLSLRWNSVLALPELYVRFYEVYMIDLDPDAKVSKVTHKYSCEPPEKDYVAMCITMLTAHLCVVWCMIWWFASIERSMVITNVNTEAKCR